LRKKGKSTKRTSSTESQWRRLKKSETQTSKRHWRKPWRKSKNFEEFANEAVLRKKIEIAKLNKNEAEEKKHFAELQKTYDPRKDPDTEEGLAQLKSQLEAEIMKLDRIIRNKQLEVNRKTLESEVDYYEKILKKKVA